MTAVAIDELEPTDEQLAAIGHPLAPLLLVAGAGSGKTEVMARRALHLVRDGQAEDHEILCLTFTNKAAANLRKRVREALGPDANVTVATYHSFGASLVADHALELDLDPGTQVLNRAQAWQLLFTVFDEFRFRRRKTLAGPQFVLNDALDLASRCADFLVPVEAVLDDCGEIIRVNRWKHMTEKAEARSELCQVVAAYEQRKRERNLIDYGDQIRLAVQLLEGHPDLAANLRQQQPVVLLDEYQDTNYAQRRMLELVHPPGSAITAVGDDMQSIYAFRGAHLRNLTGFLDHFGPGERLPLQVTFRFGDRLTRLANRIQAEVPEAQPKQLRAADDAPATEIECFLAADQLEEAATIADDVKGRGAPFGDTAVLCRKRRLTQAIVAALEERGVPVDPVGASGLLDRPEVVDLIAWLELLADPGASVALLRILEGPRYRVGLRDLAALARHRRSLEGTPVLADAVAEADRVPDLSPAARSRLMAFELERAALVETATHLPVLDLAEAIILRTGLWRASGERGRQNLLRLLDLAERFAPVEGDPGLPAFCEYLRLLDETEEDLAEFHPSERDAVRVMTVHQAKGLQYDTVYVPGLAGSGSSRIFPDTRAGENPVSSAAALPWWLREHEDDLPDWRTARQSDITDALRARRAAEEWRLLYVACTRARRHLVCSAAHWYFDTAVPQGPSEFYELIRGECVDAGYVEERFRHEPADRSPDIALKERQGAAARRGYAAPVREDAAQLSLDEAVVAAPPRLVRQPPAALSVTSLVSYARCPRQFHWSVVRPLPRRPSAAARLGTEVHRWIERRAGRQLALLGVEDDFIDAGGEGDGERLPASVDARRGLQESFLASPYAALDPERVEAPFALAVGSRLVRGRVDAVYGRDGRTELVDFKTGLVPAHGDGGGHMQLDLYALAAVDTWGVAPERLRTAYCYLRADGPAEVVADDWHSARLDAVRARLTTTLDELGEGRDGPTAGAWCHRCDFLAFCPAGQSFVAAQPIVRTGWSSSGPAKHNAV